MGRDLNKYEWEVLEMIAGERPGEWGAWVGACIETLQGMDYCTPGPEWKATDAGRAALAARKTEGE